MSDPIYKLLQINRNIALAVFNRLVRLKGMKCLCRFPFKETQSIFGREDLVEYDDNWVDKTLLIFNLLQVDQNIGGDNEFDPWEGEQPFVLTLYEDRMPIQTQIKVDFYGRQMTLKVDHHRNYTPHIHEQLFIKNILVPAT